MSSAYTKEQVDHYLAHIGVPSRFRHENDPRPDAEFLRVLHTHHLCTFPFEDLAIHYSKTHEIVLDTQHLYRKFMSPGGRGGYCMEQGIFFNHILRALGFHVYLSGGRVRPRINGVPGGTYMGWVHCFNIIVFEDGSRYMSDVGYGGDGPIVPLPLVHGAVLSNIGPQEVRLVYETIPDQVDSSQKQWIYQFRNSPSAEFNSCYCFPGSEFIQEDFEVMNFYTSKNKRSYMVTTAVVVRFLHDNYQIYGKRMLVNDEVKENVGDKTKMLRKLTKESQCMESLLEDFDMVLDAADQKAIHDTTLALA